MRIEHVSHACLLIDTGDVRLLTDPWFAGPAYCGQWHVFPRPLDPDALGRVDAILISHAHEDHLHPLTLARFARRVKVLYPYYWYGGTPEWIRGMGFSDVVEAVSQKTYRLTPDTAVTFLVNAQDSIIVIESRGRVVVDVNDALHSSEPHVIDLYVERIRRRWPEIDVVLCGFGGASFYPNTIHVEGKDDRAVGRVREELFAWNFGRIVSGLAPRTAVPFAADFVLLREEQRWINDVRFPKHRLPEYVRAHFGSGTRVHEVYPGDRLVDHRFEGGSPYRAELRDGRLDHLVERQYGDVMAWLASRPTVPDEQVEDVVAAFRKHVAERAGALTWEQLDGIDFAIELRDAAERPWVNVAVRGNRAVIERAAEPAAGKRLLARTTTEVLGTSVASEWGGDAVIIGYGCDFDVLDRTALEDGSFEATVELLIRHPFPADYARRHPVRIARYVAQSWFAMSRRLRRRAAGAPSSVVKGRHWLESSPEEIRRTCGLPAEPFPAAVGAGA